MSMFSVVAADDLDEDGTLGSVEFDDDDNELGTPKKRKKPPKAAKLPPAYTPPALPVVMPNFTPFINDPPPIYAYSPPQPAPSAPEGHSTRDAVLDTINTSVASIFGNKSNAQPFAPDVSRARSSDGNSSLGSQASSTVTNFLQGVADSFGVSQTTLIIGGAAGLYLLFKPPPSRRR